VDFIIKCKNKEIYGNIHFFSQAAPAPGESLTPVASILCDGLHIKMDGYIIPKGKFWQLENVCIDDEIIADYYQASTQ